MATARSASSFSAASDRSLDPIEAERRPLKTLEVKMLAFGALDILEQAQPDLHRFGRRARIDCVGSIGSGAAREVDQCAGAVLSLRGIEHGGQATPMARAADLSIREPKSNRQLRSTEHQR